MFGPAFGEYAAGASAAGGAVSWVTAREEDAFRWDLDQGVETIVREGPALVFVGSPNNPTGGSLSQADAQRIAEACRGILIVDEAYRAFAERPLDPSPLLEMDHVVLLRSMTKDYALAGLRLGYLVAAADVVERVRRLQPAWSVNAMAQAAGLAALRDEGYLARARQEVRRAKAFLMRQLESLGLAPLPSDANFVLVKVGHAREVRLRLLKRGLLVRDCASFGLPEHVRIAVRRTADCRRLVAALAEAVADG